MIGRLPHWEIVGGRYFITIHLTGAIPYAAKKEIRATSQSLKATKTENQPEWLRLHRKIFADMESWLDRAKNNLWLKEPSIAEMISEAIDTRQHRREWNVFEYVIMPNHIHLFCEIGSRGLKFVLEDFKRWTGHRSAQLLVENERYGTCD